MKFRLEGTFFSSPPSSRPSSSIITNCLNVSIGIFILIIAVASTSTGNPSNSGPIESREAYFNGSAYLRLLTPMPLWGHSAISFRTCRGGEILSQQYNRYTFWVTVLANYVTVALSGPNTRVEARIPGKLLDNRWHTIQFLYQYGALNVIIDQKSMLIANSTYNSQFLTNEEVKNEAAVLILGNTYSGCLLHGPGLIFNASSMHAQGVLFGLCPLATGPCTDHDILIRVPIDYCLHDPCMQHGSCISKQDSYECHCTARYSGKNCEVDAGPPCLSQPCMHSGTCQEDAHGNYQCICPPNFSGTHCETKVSIHPLCEANPCFNNGTCKVSANGKLIECECAKGFIGQHCETDRNDCESQPCLNNGQCVDEIGGFSCNCSGTGYSGTICQNNIDECTLNNPCQNGGTCYDTYGFYTCECLPGYGGINCEQIVNECQYQPCQHGATCKDYKGRFECICPTGYSGTFCELSPPCPTDCPIDSECVGGKCICKPGTTGPIGHCVAIPNQGRLAQLNACPSGICLNGGTCSGNASYFTCNCASGFTGNRCETVINSKQIPSDACVCMNGGTCKTVSNIAGSAGQTTAPNTANSNTTHICICPPGFEGTHCERVEMCNPSNCNEPMKCLNGKCICPENTNCAMACNSAPCSNGATCRNKGTSEYECICPEGWTGINCADDIDECSKPSACGHGICVNQPGSFKCYCEPGFTGLRCDSDVDECLSHPCKNGASCVNKVNDYECICPPGYAGKNCEVNIDECASNPCSKGSTCIDMVGNFQCVCVPGMTGRLCDIDIDDCESQPCQHGGKCIDELGSFFCDCQGTGYSGDFCQHNIDECLSNPCQHGARCVDKINDYQCNCFPGYAGKNCEIDINECDSNPCQYNGTCLERSNLLLYNATDKHLLPAVFSQEFSFETAHGYECICVPGITGKNCEININECDSNPCSKHGLCIDGIGNYTCECDPGFEGPRCEKEINECEKYIPCIHGTCIDRQDDYECDCDSMWGGKNCSVSLIGCMSAPCQNGGTCKPYLVNETEHKFNCSCQHGFQGDTCEKVTTMSLVASSLMTVNTSRDEGYDINLEFKTTLPNGILAFGKGDSYSYILGLVNGRLNLHSSLLNKWEGVFIGSGLNDSNWQKVFVAINSSHLVLSANEEQTIYPINSYEGTNGSHTTFPTTNLGGTIPNLSSYLRHLSHHEPSSFVGCMQDVVINGKWVFPNEPSISFVNVQEGCPRTEQCKPNPCHSNGECKDLWHTFSCTCQRPHLGHTCKYNITAATFGHENTTHSAVIVETSESARRAVRSVLDISMFIRTRQSSGQVFYLGSDPRKSNSASGIAEVGDSYVSAKLHGGELLVKMQFNGTPEAYTVGGNKLDNGHNHLIQVVRNLTLVQVKLNGTEYFRKTLSSTGQLDAQVLYLGAPAPTIDGNEVSPSRDEEDKRYFKGIIQDVQISNGSHTMIVEFYPLNEEDLNIPPPFGDVTIDRNAVLKGEVSDDLCRQKPCQHNADCRNTWNDFICTCPKGYKGKFCQDIQFCELNKCPGDSICKNLDDGFECITNITFEGNEKAPMSFVYYPKDSLQDHNFKPILDITYRTKTGGTLLHLQNNNMYFQVSAFKGIVTAQWQLRDNEIKLARLRQDETDFGWKQIYIRIQDGMIEGDWKGWETLTDGTVPTISEKIDQVAINELFSGDALIFLGGMSSADINSITKGAEPGVIYKGCLGEVRLGDFLLPYFTYAEMFAENIQARSHFRLNSTKPSEGCILCFQHDCKNGGYCSDPSEQYACQCMPGYEGDDCSQNIDECITANCTNNSTCVDKIAGFQCVCLSGYEGEYCEHEIDECASSPCHNGGNCTDLIAGFRCDCTDEYAGPQCDVLKLVTCENYPCRNGSTCMDGYNATTGNNFTCSCLPGLLGSLCDIPFCSLEPCQNGGFCLTTEPTLFQPPICQCSVGYTGKYCEIDINECESQPCQNNGRCVDLVGAFTCNCNGTGFEGYLCEMDINECDIGLITCGGRGSCENTFGSYKCHCERGLCGSNCNLPDPCEKENPCMNGGQCEEACTEHIDYRCNCTEDFTGKNCSESKKLEAEGPTTADIILIVVPIVVIILAAGGALLGAFIVMARNKRATRGTYSPSAQEYCNPRLEMDNVLKPPPEERLI